MHKEYDLFLPWEANKKSNIFAGIREELFFRLNPHWVINTFVCVGGSYTAEITDHETDLEAVIKGDYSIDMMGFLRITAEGTSWQSIKYFEKNGSLHADVSYSEEPSEEVEKQLVLWLRSIKEYLRLFTKNTIYTRLFRLLMNRVILQMSPSQRKISLMLVRITILELLVIVIILVGWFFFLR